MTSSLFTVRTRKIQPPKVCTKGQPDLPTPSKPIVNRLLVFITFVCPPDTGTDIEISHQFYLFPRGNGWYGESALSGERFKMWINISEDLTTYVPRIGFFCDGEWVRILKERIERTKYTNPFDTGFHSEYACCGIVSYRVTI